MRFNFCVILVLSSLSALAQNEICLDPDPSSGKNKIAHAIVEAVNEKADGDCPNPKKLRGLCLFVSSREEDSNPQGDFIWKYQRKILEAACVDVSKDSKQEIAKKIAEVWNANENLLVCNNTRFDVQNGNILKFAVNMKFDEFLIDATQWKVNLNKVDATDKRTVLDYVRDQRALNKDLATERYLVRYYQLLKDAGAKHSSQL